MRSIVWTQKQNFFRPSRYPAKVVRSTRIILCGSGPSRILVFLRSWVLCATRPQHGANVKITTPSTNHSNAKIKPYPKNSRKFTRATPATITYQNGAIRFPI